MEHAFAGKFVGPRADPRIKSGDGDDDDSSVAESIDVRFAQRRGVSKGTFNPDDRKANIGVLDEGTLSVAKLDADGELTWIPLIHGQGPLTAENGFADQAAETDAWGTFLLLDDPSKPEQGAKYNPEVPANGWFAGPHNIAFDRNGRMWIASDGANDFDLADGPYRTDTDGEGPALPRQFFACSNGA